MEKETNENNKTIEIDEIMKELLELIKKDLDEKRVYREDTLKASIYHHLRNWFPEKYIYTEIKFLNEEKKWKKVDIAISNKSLENGEETNIEGIGGVEYVIEIKYKKSSINHILEKIDEDIKKLSKIKFDKNINKIVLFVYEYSNEIDILKEIVNKLPIKDDISTYGLYYNFVNGEYFYSENNELLNSDSK